MMPDGSSPTAPTQAVIAEALSRDLPEAGFAFIYGSHGTRFFGEESDLDLAVYLGRPLSTEERLQICSRLEAALHHSVDLLDLFVCDPIVGHQVLKGGRLLFVRHPAEFSRFQVKVLSSYLDQKLDRLPIERAMLAGA